MKHKIKVVILPTKDITDIVIFNNKLHLNNGYVKEDNQYLLGDEFSNSHQEPISAFEFQNIYITISQDVEPIKEGDWLTDGRSLMKIDCTFIDIAMYQGSVLWSKIIATTDKLGYSINEPDGLTGYYVSQLQQSFLKEYVANTDGEWEVEYEEIIRCYKCNKLEENCINTSTNCLGYFEGIDKLKLNQDNTVNIAVVEEKMLPLSEVEILCKKAFFSGGKSSRNLTRGVEFETSEDWIKENL